jgi:hypothetical protein
MKTNHSPGTALICLTLLITITTLVLAGCMESGQKQQDQMIAVGENQGEKPVATAIANTGTITAQPSSLPHPSTPFIAIDPISDKNTGDLIIISGTTNLPSGASIYLKEVNESTGDVSMRANHLACPDTSGVNRWRFIIDSTPWMRPGTHRFQVSTPKGDVNSPVQFNLTGRFLGPETILYYESGSRSATIPGSGSYPYIIVNPIGDHKKGDIFRITGTTNLVEGTLLQCTVWPEYYEDRSKRPAIISKDDCDGQFIIAGSPAAIVKGTGDTNRWICPVDLRISPENIGMIVHVSTTDEYFTVREIFGNATFTLT